jgi:hypothetical protein
MKTRILSVIAVLFVTTVSFAGTGPAGDLLEEIKKIECPGFSSDPLGYVGCQLFGTTLVPFVTITGFVATTEGTSVTSAGVARKEALLNEAAPFAANYLISPESEEGNPVLQAAFQIVADEPNALVVGSPELAQKILDSVKTQ